MVIREIKEVVVDLILEFRGKDSNIYLRIVGRIKQDNNSRVRTKIDIL